MRIAVTGADGFTGRYVAEALAARGSELVPLSADIMDAAAIDAEVAATSFDGLLHLAALAFVGVSDWRGFYQVNQIGTYNLLEAVAHHRPGVRCVLASSAQIYGPQASGIVDEDARPDPTNAYAVSKYAMELGSAHWADKLSISIVRPFNYTGVGQEEQYLIPKIVSHFRARKPVIELGNTDVARDFGDVRAVAAAYAGLLLDSSQDFTVNVCSGTVTRLRDVIAMATELTGHEIEIRVNPAFVRAGDVSVLGGDATRLRTLLPDWSPIPIRETLAWMLSSQA
jgi:nucleoside-diphosphate-sugar epimerase